MTILFVASEDGDGLIANGLYAALSGNHFRTGFSRNALGLSGTYDSLMTTPMLPSSETMGVRFYCWSNGFSGTRDFVRFYDDQGEYAFGISNDASGSNGLAIRDPSGTKLAGTTGYSIPLSTLFKVDIIAKMAASGYIRVYVGNALVVEWNGDTRQPGAAGYGQVEWYAPGGSLTAVSEIAVADADTRTISAVATMYPDAVGTYQQWTGSGLQGVSKNSSNDSTVVAAMSQQYRSSFNLTGATTTGIANPRILCVAATARAARGDTGPQYLKLGLFTSIGGLDLQLQEVQPWFSEVQSLFPINKATQSEWTTSYLPNLEVAIESANS